MLRSFAPFTLAALIVLVATACTSVPSTRVIAANGVVLAPSRASATETARLFDEMSARLDALGVGLEVRPMEVWVYDELDESALVHVRKPE